MSQPATPEHPERALRRRGAISAMLDCAVISVESLDGGLANSHDEVCFPDTYFSAV